MLPIETFRASSIISKVVPSMPHLLARHLAGIGSVLDLGCGPKSPISNIETGGEKVGIEAFESYVTAARASHTHDHIRHQTFSDLEVPPKSFDAVVMLDVIEHLERDEAMALIRTAESIARKKVVISSPNGFIHQHALDGNPLQQHLSGWTVNEMRSMGYTCRGLAGPKWLRHEVDSETMGDDLLVTIRFRPRIAWFCVAAALQPLTYRFPALAFSVFSVKTMH
jgi:hypothetical protein